MGSLADAKTRIQALNAALTTIIAAIKRPRTAAASEHALPPLIDVRNDAVAHAQAVAKEVTGLTLALRPPVSEGPVVGQLDKLGEVLAKVSFVVDLLPPGRGPLAKKISWYILDVLETLQHFLPFASAALEPIPVGAEQRTRNDVLRGAKTIWTVVDKAATLPTNELEADRQSWRDAITMLDDCLEEMKEMEEAIEEDKKAEAPAKTGEEPAEAPRIRDRTDAAGVVPPAAPAETAAGNPPAQPESSPERQRISTTRHLLRLGRLLVHRLVTKTATPSAAFTDASFLTETGGLVSRLSALGDDLALELEPPQSGLADVLDQLCEVEDALANALDAAVNARGSDDLRTSEAAWMETWRKQRTGVRAKFDAI